MLHSFVPRSSYSFFADMIITFFLQECQCELQAQGRVQICQEKRIRLTGLFCRIFTSWTAEAGSYLISLKAGEYSLAARVAITFMTDEEFEAWEAEQEALEETTDEQQESGSEVESDEPEDQEETEIERSVKLHVSWDTEIHEIGSTAHVVAELKGYEKINHIP